MRKGPSGSDWPTHRAKARRQAHQRLRLMAELEAEKKEAIELRTNV